MNREEILQELRLVVDDTGTYSKWEDDTLALYLAEGQDKFCEETGYFSDISTFTLTLETGVAFYAIPERVIQVLNIYDGATKLEKIQTGDSGDLDLQGFTGIGRPKKWTADHTTGAIRLAPVPAAEDNDNVLTLHVWRYSLYDLTGYPVEGSVSTPELPARFQRACVEWAAYKAFMHHDAETQDPVKAKEHLNAFWEYVRDGKMSLDRRHNREVRVTSNPAYRT